MRKKTDIVFESGSNVTQVVPIYEVYPVYHASKIINFDWRDITFAITMRMIQKHGRMFKTFGEK
jgi:actin-related protein